MPIGDLLAKVAKGERMQPRDIEMLRQWGNRSDLEGSYTRGLQTGSTNISGLSVPFPVNTIYSQTFSVDTTTLTVQIPSGYNHLFIIGSGRTGAGGSGSRDIILLRFNGDTGGNYGEEGVGAVHGSSSIYEAQTRTGMSIGNLPNTNADADTSGNIFCFVTNINSGFWKGMLVVDGSWSTAADGMSCFAAYGVWKNTDIVRSITLVSDDGNDFVAGTQISVFGLL